MTEEREKYTTELDHMVDDLRECRSALQRSKAALENLRLAPEYLRIAAEIEHLKTREMMLSGQIREKAEGIYIASGNKRPHDKIRVSLVTDVRYNYEDAMDWCKVNLPEALTLQVKTFESFCRKVRATSFAPDFVMYIPRPRAEIATCLDGGGDD